MRDLVLLLVTATALAGCGSSSVPPTATVIPVASYTDPQFGFSFRYPSSWSIPKKGGGMLNVGGVRTYVLDISVPHGDAQVSLTVDADVAPFPAFPNGKTAPDPKGPTHTFQYFHARVAGWPAMVIRRFSSKQITELDTITNTRSKSYDVRMLTATPPFPIDITAGYNQVVRSLKVPFS